MQADQKEWLNSIKEQLKEMGAVYPDYRDRIDAFTKVFAGPKLDFNLFFNSVAGLLFELYDIATADEVSPNIVVSQLMTKNSAKKFLMVVLGAPLKAPFNIMSGLYSLYIRYSANLQGQLQNKFCVSAMKYCIFNSKEYLIIELKTFWQTTKVEIPNSVHEEIISSTMKDARKRNVNVIPTFMEYYRVFIHNNNRKDEILQHIGGPIVLLSFIIEFGKPKNIEFIISNITRGVFGQKNAGNDLFGPAINKIKELIKDPKFLSDEESLNIIRCMNFFFESVFGPEKVISIDEEKSASLMAIYEECIQQRLNTEHPTDLRDRINSVGMLLHYLSKHQNYVCKIKRLMESDSKDPDIIKGCSESYYVPPLALVQDWLVMEPDKEDSFLTPQQYTYKKASIRINLFIASLLEQNPSLFDATLRQNPSPEQISRPDSSGRNALWYAYLLNKKELIYRLEELGCRQYIGDPQCCYTILMAMCASQEHINPRNIKDFKRIVNTEDPKLGRNALHYLAYNKLPQGNIENIVDLLRLAKIDINKPDKHGRTPIMYAILNNNYPLFIKLLRQHSLDINAYDEEGNSVLIHAVRIDRYDMVELILRRPDLNVRFANKQIDALTLLILKNSQRKEQSNAESQSNMPRFLGTYVSSYNRTIDSIELRKDKRLKRLVELFIERGADPGPSYASNWVRDLLFGFLTSLILWWIIKKILGVFLPKDFASSIAFSYVANYCISPVISKLITNTINSSQKNVEEVDQGFNLGIVHLDPIGLPQCKIPRKCDIWNDETGCRLPQDEILPRYFSLVSRYRTIEYLKYRLKYGSYLGILPRILTLSYRVWTLEKLQKKIREEIDKIIPYTDRVQYEKHERTLYDFLCYASYSDSALRSKAEDKAFIKLLHSIVSGEVLVSPEIYNVSVKVYIKIINGHYNRVYGVFEYIKVEVLKLWTKIVHRKYKEIDPAVGFFVNANHLNVEDDNIIDSATEIKIPETVLGAQLGHDVTVDDLEDIEEEVSIEKTNGFDTGAPQMAGFIGDFISKLLMTIGAISGAPNNLAEVAVSCLFSVGAVVERVRNNMDDSLQPEPQETVEPKNKPAEKGKEIGEKTAKVLRRRAKTTESSILNEGVYVNGIS